MAIVQIGPEVLPVEFSPLAAEMVCTLLDGETPALYCGPTPAGPRFFTGMQYMQWTGELRICFRYRSQRPYPEMLVPTAPLEKKELRAGLRQFIGNAEVADAALQLLKREQGLMRIDPIAVYGVGMIDDHMREMLSRRLLQTHEVMNPQQLQDWKGFFRSQYVRVRQALQPQQLRTALNRLDECVRAFELAWSVTLRLNP